MPRFQGRLTAPEDPGYDEARKVYNAMIDRRPALIAACADSGDVAKVVSFAGNHELLLAVRGGGHNGAGLGTCDDGVVLDLSGLKGVAVDPGARTARVGGGCTWGKWMPRPTSTAWPRRAGSSRPLASAVSRWGAALGT